MKVSQLIQELQKYDGSLNVLLAGDRAGNQLNHLEYVDVPCEYDEHNQQIVLIETEPVPDVPLHQAIVLWP